MAEERNIARKYRIYPNSEQKIMFAKTFGCVRFVYNRMLSDKIEEYQKTGKMKKTTPAQYKKEYPWLKEVDSLALANAQLHLETAYKNFFRDPKVGFPKYKSRHHNKASYTTNVVNNNIRFEDGKLKLAKVGLVKIKCHYKVDEEAKLKSATISQDASGKYYVSLLYSLPERENQSEEKTEEDVKMLGIDFAMHGLGVYSDGRRADYPMYYKKMEKKLAREQRKLSHMEKKSQNYIKQRKKLAKIHEKIRNQRKDYQHKLSKELADNYDCIAVEDLNMKAMSQGLSLGKGVSDNGYGAFLTRLQYKLEDRDKRLIRIDRFFPSSKKCSCCGKVRKELKLSERVYRCECGNVMDRDVNAAINIRNEGRRILMEQ